MLAACGDSPSRFDPGPPAVPTGLAVTRVGAASVTLTWPAADNADNYNIYYSTSTGVTTSGTKVPGTITGTSHEVTGLTTGTTYYFVLTSQNSNSESASSNEVFGIPFARVAFDQADLEGTWRFNALAAGTSSGWIRGTLTVTAGGSGAVTVDSSGTDGSPPEVATLFPQLLVSADGVVGNAADSPTFTGVMNTDGDMVVGTWSSGDARLIAVLLKDLGASFSNDDLVGFGNALGGARRFAYNQISSGAAGQEWEFAQGQLGRNSPPRGVSYTASDVPLPFLAPSNPALPGDKATILSITPDGIVTEALNTDVATAVPPPPAVVLSQGVMTDDKSVIVGTATDTSGAEPRYVLRVYQLINIVGNDPNTYSLDELSGTYAFRDLAVGATTLTASGTMQIDATGEAAFSDYLENGAAAASPSGFSLAIDLNGLPAGVANGILTDATGADATIHGKLSYDKGMVILTRTDAAGASRLTVAVK